MIQAGQAREQNTYRWVILAVAFAIIFMTGGTRSTFGVFFKPMIAELGWSRGTISLVVAVNIWLSGLLQPLTGYVMDRYGAKWLLTGAVAVFGLGTGLVGLTYSVGYLLVIYGIIVAIASAGASISLTNALVAQWFPAKRRGLALGINNAGSAVGQLSLVWISALLLQAVDWRWGYIYLGLAVMMVTAPVALLIPGRQAQADGDTQTPGRAQTTPAPLEVQRWSEALHSMPLWQINVGYFVCGMTVSLYATHLIPFATDRGFSITAAATAFGLLSVCSAVGALLSGLASDRLGRKNMLALAYLIRCGAFAVLLFWRHDLALYVFAVVGGLVSLATPTSVVALTGEVYGMRTLGTLSGISTLLHQIGGGMSVWLAGVLHDQTGSYEISFTLALVALAGASLVSWSISERRYSVRYMESAPSVE